MTVPSFAQDSLQHYNRLKNMHGKRDAMHNLIHGVRQGNMRQLFPDELNFELSFDGVPIANFIDIVARDMAEAIAPLPALACTSGKMRSDADRKRAETKDRIGDYYWTHSDLEEQMLRGADRYITYGFVPFFIEPDTQKTLPFIHLEDPRHSYYEKDRYGKVLVYAKRWLRSIDELCAQFPEYTSLIKRPDPMSKKEDAGSTELDLVRWVDDTKVTLLLPARDGLVLGSYEHKMGRAPVVVAERPGEADSPRGQFDDVIWVQVARAIMSTLALEAAHTAVQMPIAVPSDMDEFPVGPKAILQSENADKIHQVQYTLPSGIFAEAQVLDQELKTGSRYPDARAGGVQGASVITGKGVEALLGTFDTQIKGAQMVFRRAFEKITALAFEYDEKWWPNVKKTISGTLSGSSWEYDYTPSVDIAGRYTCTVTYGFAAGMAPSQSVITMLQLQGAGLIAKGTLMENLPFGMDQMQEKRKIDVEGLRDAIKQGVFAMVQAAGQMAAQGSDPTPVIAVAVEMVHDLQQGKSVEDAFANAMQKQKEAAAQAQQDQQDQAGAAPGGAPPDAGGGPPGPPDQGHFSQAPGQAGMPPGGMPTVENLIAGMRGNAGVPVNQATIQRRVPTGT